jgi:hypothetical protein
MIGLSPGTTMTTTIYGNRALPIKICITINIFMFYLTRVCISILFLRTFVRVGATS